VSDNIPDENGMRITKTIVNEIVKLKKADIWWFYEGIEQHPEEDNPEEDTHIKRWIEILLKSPDSGTSRSSIN